MSDNLFADTDNIRQLIHQIVGLSSTCWVGGTGGLTFDSTLALKVADHALTRLAELQADDHRYDWARPEDRQ